MTRVFGFKEVDRMTGAALAASISSSRPNSGGASTPGSRRRASATQATSAGLRWSTSSSPPFKRTKTRAKNQGATITEELVDLPFGHRRYTCRDPQGHEWGFAQVLEGASE
jgi:uncharacterized glyoxalase superfamily protein PhnB